MKFLGSILKDWKNPVNSLPLAYIIIVLFDVFLLPLADPSWRPLSSMYKGFDHFFIGMLFLLGAAIYMVWEDEEEPVVTNARPTKEIRRKRR